MRASASMSCAVCVLMACEGGESATPRDGGDLAMDAAPAVDAAPAADAALAVDARAESDAQREAGQEPAPDAGAPPLEAGPADAALACVTPEEEKFSFFMISYKAIVRESGSPDGFGGNLGGIEGADALCQRVAEYSSPCQKTKVWRAFLSTTKEDAIDRIGTGPWHDRLGRILANSLEDLVQERPAGAHPLIVDDFPNEDGVPNRNPDGTGNVDNHQTLTGSGLDGRLYNPDGGGGLFNACGPSNEPWTPEKATCWDWTSAEPAGCPRVGHSWPRRGSGIHWISVGNEGGCAPGAELEERGGLDGTRRVGSAGGYGGFYCFALTP